jgi:ATP-dependent Clp protease ATP-binding subunit ClpA
MTAEVTVSHSQSLPFGGNSQNNVYYFYPWQQLTMKKIEFPLLCFRLRDDSFLGLLVGTELQVVDSSVKRIKSVLTDTLLRQYRKDGDYPLSYLTEPALKMVDTFIMPAYRREGTAFPLSATIKFTTPLVYGKDDEGNYECALPLLGETFYCHELKQLDTLVKHFVTNAIDRASPEALHRMNSYPVPTLEIVSLQIKDDPFFVSEWNVAGSPQLLERLAEKYPYPKSIRKQFSGFPEAAWEMDEHVNLVLEKLTTQKSSVLLTGNTGVGKSAVLGQAIRKITTSAKKQRLDYSCWRIQAQRFTATSKYLGEWQETVEALIWELASVNGMLWVENVSQLLGEGGRSVEDSVAAYILPFIQQGKLQLVGEATPQQLESMRRRLPGFVESVQVLEIPDLPEKTINLILSKFSAYVRQNLKIHINEDALNAGVRLLKRYYPYESFPGKGIRFFSECVHEAQLSGAQEVTRRDMIAQFSRRTGFPELFLRDDLLLDQKELKTFFDSRIIGQEAAVEKLCDIVKVFKAGLNNPHKPITTLIFAGPTGVGKTASAKTLSEYFFGKGQKQSPLIRIDMSEFQHAAQISRFIGTSSNPGQMIGDVRERPFSVLLLDEADKADASIFDAFLNVLDEGTLVDAIGRVTNFRNCIIILTSNLGASERNSIGFKTAAHDEESKYRSAISRNFRPEFMNRIDGIVVFQSLNKADIRRITLKELEEVKSREGFAKKNLQLRFTENLVNYLADSGFHERYGARPLQRALEDHVVKPLAKWLLRHREVSACELEIDFDKKLIVRKAGR